MSEVRRFADPVAVADATVAEFVELAGAAVRRRGRFCVALPGGSTPRALYRALAGSPLCEQMDWTRVEVFWGDERQVPPDDPESNYGMARDMLLSKVDIPAVRIHRIKGELADLEETARQYEQEIARVFSVSSEGAAPAFDLILLGMGADGHTASLFPYSRAVPVRRRWAVANYRPGLRPHRITLTAPILNRVARSAFWSRERTRRRGSARCSRHHRTPNDCRCSSSGRWPGASSGWWTRRLRPGWEDSNDPGRARGWHHFLGRGRRTCRSGRQLTAAR